jgi:hypothetical protein
MDGGMHAKSQATGGFHSVEAGCRSRTANTEKLAAA